MLRSVRCPFGKVRNFEHRQPHGGVCIVSKMFDIILARVRKRTGITLASDVCHGFGEECGRLSIGLTLYYGRKFLLPPNHG
jgi:hypothetical protein